MNPFSGINVNCNYDRRSKTAHTLTSLLPRCFGFANFYYLHLKTSGDMSHKKNVAFVQPSSHNWKHPCDQSHCKWIDQMAEDNNDRSPKNAEVTEDCCYDHCWLALMTSKTPCFNMY